MAGNEHVGIRVQAARKLKGWSQQQLADSVGYSLSTVKKIEQGRRPIDRYSTLNAFARALGVEVAQLTGQPLRLSRRNREHSIVPGLRAALTVLPLEVPDGPTLAIADLRDSLAHVVATRESGRYRIFGKTMPTLLEELHRASQGPHAAVAHSLLTEALHSTAILLRRLGYLDLAYLAVLQARTAATLADDPLLGVANDWHLIELAFRTGDTARADRITHQALTRLEEHLHQPDPRALSLLGTLHLLQATAAAQHVDTSGVGDALSQATDTARRTGERDDYQTVFGPANVAIFTVATAVEMGHGAAAVDRARRIDAAAIPSRERRARYLIDVARGHGQIGRDSAALALLTQADTLAAEYVRNHLMARELTRSLVEHARTLPEGLRSMARHMDIA